METQAPKATPILEVAWMRYAQLDASSLRRTTGYRRLRIWIAILSVLATLLSIVYATFFIRYVTDPESGVAVAQEDVSLLGLLIKFFFVLIPIVASLLAAFASRTFANGDWLITRAAAEEYLKEIYFFRTVLRGNLQRREYMEKRINEIQRQLYRGLGGELAFRPYQGAIPPYYSPDYGNDPGFNDLTGDEYFKYRLEDQLRWHIGRINRYKRERVVITVLVLAGGGLGALLAAWGGVLSIWVALTASITAALVGWQQLRNLDAVIKNFSKVILELTTLYDHWTNLEAEERTDAEFYKMVRGCEDVLWAQNTEWIKTMQEALKESDLEKEASLVNRVIKESVESAERTKEMMRATIIEETQKSLEAAEGKVEEVFTAAVGSLAEEASSEVVQKELEAMSKAITDAAGNAFERASALTSSLAQIAMEFAHIDIGRDTTKEELNAILARYPKTGEVKG
jgi:hypothetical protein